MVTKVLSLMNGRKNKQIIDLNFSLEKRSALSKFLLC